MTPARGLALLTSIVAVATISLAAAARVGTGPRAADAEGVPGCIDFSGACTAPTLALDCDVTTAAIDVSCHFPSGTTSVDIGVVLTNNDVGSMRLGAFDFEVITEQQAAFAPKSGVDGNLNGNPDFNDAAVTGSWQCAPSAPDNDADPSRARSSLACFNAGNGPLLAPAASLRLATVHYASVDAWGAFSLGFSHITDDGFTNVGSCNDASTPPPALCVGTQVEVGDIGTPTPTPTSTPLPTDTPTPTATPTFAPTPNGGVAGLVGLNTAVCVTAGVVIARTSPHSAPRSTAPV